MPTCSIIRGSFPHFLIQNTSKGSTSLKQGSGADSSPGNPPIRAKQEFAFLFMQIHTDWDM